MTRLNPLKADSWAFCEEHDTQYMKDAYCKDCRISELEADRDKWQALAESASDEVRRLTRIFGRPQPEDYE